MLLIEANSACAGWQAKPSQIILLACILSVILLPFLPVRLAAAQSGDGSSGGDLLQQARKYNERNGVPLDYKKAAQLFKQSADGGSPEGKAWLGNMYLRGHYVTRDVG